MNTEKQVYLVCDIDNNEIKSLDDNETKPNYCFTMDIVIQPESELLVTLCKGKEIIKQVKNDLPIRLENPTEMHQDLYQISYELSNCKLGNVLLYNIIIMDNNEWKLLNVGIFD